ncbi:hypothetical protein D3C72_1672570 [compost metagenome]
MPPLRYNWAVSAATSISKPMKISTSCTLRRVRQRTRLTMLKIAMQPTMVSISRIGRGMPRM